jgi:hypothetical protein
VESIALPCGNMFRFFDNCRSRDFIFYRVPLRAKLTETYGMILLINLVFDWVAAPDWAIVDALKTAGDYETARIG